MHYNRNIDIIEIIYIYENYLHFNIILVYIWKLFTF